MKQMTRCKYHQNDIVSFCLNVGCLLPLCPQCIAQHQAYHFQTSTQMCIVKLEQSIEAAQIQLSSMLLPLAKLRSTFHDVRCQKLEVFYQKIQRQKAALLMKVEEEFNQITSSYVESIEQSLIATRQKLQSTIMDIENNSIGLASGSRTIQTLVEFWINRRTLSEKVRSIEKDINSGVGMSGTQSLNTTIMKNIEIQIERGISSTKQLFRDVPMAVGQIQNNFIETNYTLNNYNQSDSHPQVYKQRVADRISVLQQQNRRILKQLGDKRMSRQFL